MGGNLTNASLDTAEVRGTMRLPSASCCRFQARALDLGTLSRWGLWIPGYHALERVRAQRTAVRSVVAASQLLEPFATCMSLLRSSASGAIHLGGCIAGEPGERCIGTPRTPVTSRPPLARRALSGVWTPGLFLRAHGPLTSMHASPLRDIRLQIYVDATYGAGARPSPALACPGRARCDHACRM